MKKVAASIERNERADLTIEDIRTVLWDGTFKECSDLLDSLYNRTIKLREVDHYFGDVRQLSTTFDPLKSQLQKLCTGINDCINSDKQYRLSLIDDVVQDICCFWSMFTFTEEARAVIELKTKLLLSDDFEKVEILVNPVSSYSQFSNYNNYYFVFQEKIVQSTYPLSVIDDLKAAGNFLIDIKKDPPKIDCLHAFVESSNIINWIRNEAPEGK